MPGPGSAVVGLVLVARLAAASPEVRFERLENPTGPSHNSIFAITQDHLGFLWVGTQDGLDRFDGYRFRSFHHLRADPGSLSASRVNAVLEDRRRRLWVGTAAGIDRLDRASGRFRRYPLAPPGAPAPVSALDLVADPGGGLWAGSTAGLFRYDEGADRWLPALPGEPPFAVRRVRPAAGGGLWLLGTGELRRIRGGRTVGRWPLAGEVYGLDVAADGGAWIDAGGPLPVPLPPGERIGGGGSTAVLAEPSGDVWVATGEGLVRRRGVVAAEPFVLDARSSLANAVVVLFRDRAGILWAGTENGLYRDDPHRKPFRHLDAGERGASFQVSALAEDDAGVVWVATFGAGLYRLEGDDAVARPVGPRPGGSPREAIWALAPLPGGGVLAGGNGWLCAVSGGGAWGRCRVLEDLGRVGQLAPGGGELWMAENWSLRRRDAAGSWRRFRPAGTSAAFGGDEMTCMLPDGDRVWAGYFGGRLRVLRLADGRFEAIARADAAGWEQVSPVFDLLRDRRGRIWLGTGDGLSRFDPQSRRFRHYARRDGLPAGNVYSILEDAGGRLWLGTNRGLVRFDPGAPAGRRFRAYGTADGVRNVEFNRHARLRRADGTFLFGGMAGITAFQPEEIADNPLPPPVALTRIEVFGDGGVRRVEPYGRATLRLAPDDSMVALEIAALSFTSPAENRYASRLVGVDRGWVELGTGRELRYSGLPPGRYPLLVKAANNDGAWGEAAALVTLEVAPAFWQTVWFRALLVAAVAALLALLYRWRIRHLIELERMRLRIAGDLHDELGSELSGIALAVSRLERRRDLAEADRRRLADVRGASLQVLEGLRDIVWVVNPEHDTLGSMARRMRSTAAGLLADVEHRFTTDLEGDERTIDMAARRNLFLAFKELLHNVVRHSAAAHVEIALGEADGWLRLTVADDGVGFDPAAAADGTGLASLRRRAARLAASLDLDSRPGGGCRVELALPMTRMRQRRRWLRRPRLRG